MVFDDIVRSLNEALWGPNLMLMLLGSLLIVVDLDTHMVVLDVGRFSTTSDSPIY